MRKHQFLISTTLAIACAMPAVWASESGVYASLRQSVVYTDSGAMTGDTDDISVVDQESRVGFQGNQDFGTYSGFGRAEFGFNGGAQGSGMELRLGYVGISGNFGTLSVGSQWSAWDTYVGGTHTNFVGEGNWQNGPGRNGSTVKYAGKLGILSIETDLVFEGRSATANDGALDEVQVAFAYGSGGITLQGAIVSRDDGASGYLGGGKLYGARITYDAGPLTLSFAVAQDDQSFGSADTSIVAANEETTGMKFKASYAAGSNTFLAVVTSSDNKVAANTPQAVALGYQHDLSNRSRVSLELSSVDPDLAGLDASIEGGVMYRHDW